MPSSTDNYNILIPDSDKSLIPQIQDMVRQIDAAMNTIATGGGTTVGLPDPGHDGIVIRTGAGVTSWAQMVQGSAGFRWTNPDGVAGSGIALTVADDLGAIEALTGTGFANRVGSSAWSLVSVVSAAQGGTGVNNGSFLLTVPASGTAAIGAGTLSVSSGNVFNSASHTHAISSSNNPGAAASILATDSSGLLSIFIVKASSVDSHWIPSLSDTYDLGSSTKLWRKGWLSEMDAVLFAKNTIQVIGGWFYITKFEGVLQADVTNSQTTIDFGQTLALNDFVVLRSVPPTGLQVEYMQITSSTNPHTVTRNVDGSGGNSWPAGTVYADLGYNGNGRIELDSTNTPRIAIMRQGTSYNTQTEVLRMGDLNGNWGIGAETYGFATGQYGGSTTWISIEPTNGIRLGQASTTQFQIDNSANITMGAVATNYGNAFWNNSNKRLEFRGGTSGTTVQSYIDTDGSIVAASGSLKLNTDGIGITTTSGGGYSDPKSYRFTDSSGVMLGQLKARYDSSGVFIELAAVNYASHQGTLYLTSDAPTSTPSQIEIQSRVNGATGARILVDGYNQVIKSYIAGTLVVSVATGTLDIAGRLTILSGGGSANRVMIIASDGTTNRYAIDNASGVFRIFRENVDGSSGDVKMAFFDDGGICIGTGTSQGNHTINISGNIYKNGTAYTNPDYVLEHWATGAINKFKSYEGAKDYDGLWAIPRIEGYLFKNYTLPRIKQARDRGRGKLGLFDGGDAVLASLEEAYLLIIQLDKRIKELEGQNE